MTMRNYSCCDAFFHVLSRNIRCQIEYDTECTKWLDNRLCHGCCLKHKCPHITGKAYYMINDNISCIPILCVSCDKQMCFYCHAINTEKCLKCSDEMEKVD